MNNKPAHSERSPFARPFVALLLAGLATLSGPLLAQNSAAPTAPEDYVPLDDEGLDTLVGPIALYPDDLLSIVLPASTYPLQIVQAARFLDALEDDPSLEPDIEWDNSVVALLNYPEVLRMMDADLDWTWQLGEAVLAQQADVIDAVQDFRDRAYLAGNLATDDRQVVTETDGVIEIAPADPEVVYIPYYEPERVVVVQPRPVYYYYPSPYPLYYYPYPYGYHFSTGFFWGVTSAFSIGWHTHYFNVYHHSHLGHPYYAYDYYTPFYYRRGINININLNHESHIWQAGRSRGARPRYGRPETRVTRSREGYARDLAETGAVRVSSGSRTTLSRRVRPAGTVDGTTRSGTSLNQRPGVTRATRSNPARSPDVQLGQRSEVSSRASNGNGNLRTSTGRQPVTSRQRRVTGSVAGRPAQPTRPRAVTSEQGRVIGSVAGRPAQPARPSTTVTRAQPPRTTTRSAPSRNSGTQVTVRTSQPRTNQSRTTTVQRTPSRQNPPTFGGVARSRGSSNSRSSSTRTTSRQPAGRRTR
jgi:hypothetical protein